MFGVEEIEVDVMIEVEQEPYTPPTSVPVVHGAHLKSGTALIAGMMPFGALLPLFEIPHYNYTTKEGYQRLPQMSRISRFASEIRRGRVDFPTAVLLNLRSSTPAKAVTDGMLHLDRLGGAQANGKFFVVDGQHRILALKKAYEDGWRQALDLMVPFTCLLGASANEEMKQFYLVNANAKSVRTDLAFALLNKRNETEPDLMESLQEKGRDWQIFGQAIVERLAADSNAWRNRIRLPGMPKGETTIPSASMVTSLKPVLASAIFKRLGQEQQIRVLDAYWAGIGRLLPEAIEHPTEFTVQKGVGVTVMHAILAEVLEVVRDKGYSPTDPDTYAEMLSDSLLELEGENSEGDAVEGVMFWAAAPRGAAGSLSSSAGLRVLTARIRSKLPQLELEA